MDVNRAIALLGGLSPAAFMRRHWQREPLLVRQAWPGVVPPIARPALFDLAGREGVESRLLSHFDGRWRMRQGPFSRRQLPPLRRPGWTLLLQGLDLHWQAAHDMLARFRFLPDARLDDLMISYASDGGGVGPHLDSYDVFLLQVHGRRRWHIGPVADGALVEGLPVKILRNFRPTQSWLLEPGDMLYLPPLWGHDGVADGESMTCSIGYRAPGASDLARDLLLQMADMLEPPPRERLYRDAGQVATAQPARMPPALQRFASAALRRVLDKPRELSRALGTVMSEPKREVWFDAGLALPGGACSVVLDRRSRMLYDDEHVFLNGEAFVATGRDARLMHGLADARALSASEVRRLGPAARAQLDEWALAGWLHAGDSLEPP